MARSDMSDLEWNFVKVLLPNKPPGVKRVDDRRVINGIFFALRTGIPWRDMPEQYGPWSTIYNRFNRVVKLLLKVTPFCRPIMLPLRDGRTAGEEPQPDQPAGRTIPFLSFPFYADHP